jgi:GT2 family glycosyltransferase
MTIADKEIPSSPTASIAIIVLTWNQRDKTLACLEALGKVEEPAFEILVWDNGSDDGTLDAIRSAYPRVRVCRHERNLGVASGRNAAAAAAIEAWSPGSLLFLDNDIIVTRSFLRPLVEALRADPQVGQVQSKLRFLEEPDKLNDGGGCRIRYWLAETRPVGIGEIDRGQYDEITPCIACGGAMMVRTDVFSVLEGFDAAFDPVGPEDLDFSLRLQRAGYRALYVPESVVYHQVSHSFGGGKYTESYARHKIRNWFTFMFRHARIDQQLAFLIAGVPYLALRVVVREGRKGNFSSFRGLLRGLLETLQPRRPPS